VNGLKDGPLTIRRRQTTRLEPYGNLLQHVPRLDLRAAASMRVDRDRRALQRTLDLEPLQPRAIDRFERQLALEALVRSRVQISRRAERALTVEIRAVALKAQGPACSDASTRQSFQGRRVEGSSFLCGTFQRGIF
jgi:predicted component of type VI protein secretion system